MPARVITGTHGSADAWWPADDSPWQFDPARCRASFRPAGMSLAGDIINRMEVTMNALVRKAEIIRPLDGYRGEAWLVRHADRYYVVSYANVPSSGPETLVFPGNEDGTVADWAEVAGGRGMGPAEAIADLEATDPDPAVSIEIEYEDGTVARWSLPPDDTRIAQLEALLGDPGTMRA